MYTYVGLTMHCIPVGEYLGWGEGGGRLETLQEHRHDSSASPPLQGKICHMTYMKSFQGLT